MRSRSALGVLVVALLVACSGGGASAETTVTSSEAPSAAAVDLTIFAAASLANALDAARATYEATVPGATLTFSTDSSATLATQISEGAPADVFLSADTTNPQKLVDAGLADGDAVAFAGNELTIITPADNPAGLFTALDLGKAGVRVIAAGDEVPITKYATQLIENLASAADAPLGFADAYAANVASKEDNVAAIRTKIELGEGDGAIVYVTDAASSDLVATIEIDDAINVPATYAGIVVKDSSSVTAAHAFLDWLAGPAGRAIFAEFGFLPPTS